MKLAVILNLIFSLNTFAFDVIPFEKEICPRTIVPGRSPGLYSGRPVLVFQDAASVTYLQKVTERGETFL